MPKLITFSCFMLFWVFYEMSGGADFAPQERVVVSQAPFAKPATRNRAFIQPASAAQVTNASYVPVETETLVPAIATPIAVVPTPVPAILETPVAAPEPAQETIDVRFVAGNRVNLRQGPGTTHQVLDTLVRGTAAQIIAVNDDGWAQIRLTESGETGWMALRLLSDS